MLKKILLFLLPLFLHAFEVDPYFTFPAEFELRSSYAYRFYPNVSEAKCPSHYSSKDQLIDLNLGVSFWPNWDFQLETDFSSTKKLEWGTQRVGIQVRHLFLDDVVGDPVSLSVGAQIFYVPTRNMKDPSSPYHAQGNGELGIAVGKEIDRIYDWKYHFFAFLGCGIANRGAPWVRPQIAAAIKFKGEHLLQLISEGCFGLGHRKNVIIKGLNGYGKIRHQSIDLGMTYRYFFDIWGSFSLHYSYRVYAKAFPKGTSLFRVEYTFPFSLL